MRVLPIGLAIVRGSGVLLVGIGLMVVVFASRQVNPWPKARVGAAIAAIGSACSWSSELSRRDTGSALPASESSERTPPNVRPAQLGFRSSRAPLIPKDTRVPACSE